MHKSTGLAALLTLAVLTPVNSWGLDTTNFKASEAIPYRFAVSDGPSVRRRDGAIVYKNKPRGYIDNEPMLEVVYADLPREPLRVDVIPYASDEAIERGVIYDTRRKTLVGEDKIFETINQDVVKARCLLLGEGCDQTPEFKARRDSLYPPVNIPTEQLEIRTSRSKARRREMLEYR